MMRHKLIGYVNTADLVNVTDADAKNLDIINIAFGHVIDGNVTWNAATVYDGYSQSKSKPSKPYSSTISIAVLEKFFLP